MTLFKSPVGVRWLACAIQRNYRALHQLRRTTAGEPTWSYGVSIKSNPAHRKFHVSQIVSHGEYEWQDPKSEDEVVNVTFINKNDTVSKIRGKVGDNILYLAKRYEVEVEGACEASLACTTCHVYIVDDNYWDKFPPASETEEDLLDAAPFLKDNSRLGCQLILAKEHDGLTLKLPQATRNFYVDGHKPTPH